jgi:hypothetical protein
MLLVNCVVKEKFSTKTLIDFGGTVNLVNQKIISKFGLTHYNDSNSESSALIDPFYIRKLNVNGKHKSTVGTIDVRNLLLTINDDLTINQENELYFRII